MKPIGHRFRIAARSGWRVQRLPGALLAAPLERDGPVRPAVVLRESRLIRWRPTILADAAHASMLSFLRSVPGGRIVSVESWPDDLADPRIPERRCIQAVVPVPLEGGTGATLLLVHEMLIADGVLLELTTTGALGSMVPWAGADGFVRLHLLPKPTRTSPEASVDAPECELDEWASERDGQPRERIPAHPDEPLRTTGLDIPLSERAMRAFQTVISPHPGDAETLVRPGSPEGRELHEARLLDGRGRLSALGMAIAETLQQSTPWTARTADGRHELRGWKTKTEAIVALSPRPEAPNGSPHRLLHCPAEDLPRIVLHWTGYEPGWKMSFQLPATTLDLLRGHKARSASEPRLSPTPRLRARGRQDAEEFARAQWREFQLTLGADPDRAAHVRWVQTERRGAAELDGRQGRDALVADPVRLQLWNRVATILRYDPAERNPLPLHLLQSAVGPAASLFTFR